MKSTLSPNNHFAALAILAALGTITSTAQAALILDSPNGPLTTGNNVPLHIVNPQSSIVVGGTASATAGFTISLNYINAPSPTEAAAFAAAKATWESIITGYADTVGSFSLTIDVNLGPIDGPGGILGSAGPSTATVAANYLYTTGGSMTFDTADTPSLGASLNDVILHEMGHVLGIGTLWSGSAVGVPGKQELYVNGSGQYTGANALAAYNAEFGQSGSFIPVELGGGPGTANGHWNEVDGGGGLTGITEVNSPNRDFRDELMTGWLGGPTFISNTTIQSMADLGYTVVPEPGSISLLAILGGLTLIRRRRD